MNKFANSVRRKMALVSPALIAIGLFACASVPANANTIVVPRDYPTIQAAVTAAPTGATIRVRRGIYVEEIVIAKDLTVKGDGIGQTIIQAPATLTSFATQSGQPVVSVVRITDGAHVSMSDLTVSGPLPCSDVGAGIRVVKDATLNLEDSHVTRMRPESGPCPSGPPRGRGIVIGLPASVLIEGQRGSIGHGTVTDVAVDQYQEVGITVTASPMGSPATAMLSSNTVTGGESPFFPVAQVGVVLAAAAVGQVTENKVTGNVCTAAFCGPNPLNQGQGVGILALTLAAPGASEISENDVAENDVGIYQLAIPNASTISENKLKDNRFFGIVIHDGDGTTSENNIKGGEVGIAVVAQRANTVGLLNGDKIKHTSVMPVQEIQCCGFTATAIVQD